MSDTNKRAQARFNMIEQQVRPAEVLDQAVLDLLNQLPRENFVPPHYADIAYADTCIPLNGEECMLPPIMEGRLLQALALQAGDKVLEVGTGSGYFTALCAKQAKEVISVEINAELSRVAGERLAAQGISNVSLKVGNAAGGWEADAPYDAIAITGSLPFLPDSFKHSLKVGGRLVAVVGDAPVMQCLLVTRLGESDFMQEVLLETEVPILKEAAQPQRFVF